MFTEEWMEYFQKESPFSYYCIIFLQYVFLLLSYISYFALLFVVLVPILMVYFGIKTIKIKLVEDKKRKKIKQQREAHQKKYMDLLDQNLSKKKKKEK